MPRGMDEERRTRRGIAVPGSEPGPEGPGDATAPEHHSFGPSHPELAAAIVTPITRTPAETFSRHFLGISLRRAFRLHILNEEVLPQERAHLASQAGHVPDPDQQAFLAWRRSVLLLIAVMFIPLTVFRFLE